MPIMIWIAIVIEAAIENWLDMGILLAIQVRVVLCCRLMGRWMWGRGTTAWMRTREHTFLGLLQHEIAI